MKVLTHLLVRDEEYLIVKKGEWYCAINTKYVKGSKLTQELNGMQMHCAKSLNECIANVRRSSEIDFLMKENPDMSLERAVYLACERY